MLHALKVRVPFVPIFIMLMLIDCKYGLNVVRREDNLYRICK